jgi:hypothetical protein
MACRKKKKKKKKKKKSNVVALLAFRIVAIGPIKQLERASMLRWEGSSRVLRQQQGAETSARRKPKSLLRSRDGIAENFLSPKKKEKRQKSESLPRTISHPLRAFFGILLPPD